MLFTSLPTEQTGLAFSNLVVESDSFNINRYLYAYNGAGVALGDVNNDGLVDIYLGANQMENRLFLNQGNFRFEDVTEKAGVQGPAGPRSWTTGLSMVDINADGWLDIYVNQVVNVVQLEGHNLLFINNQDGTFSERSREFGLDLKTFAQQTAFFDYDGDGDLDAYLLNHSLHELDVFVKTEKRDLRDSLAGDRLLRNDQGYFRDVSEASGIYSSATGYGLAVSVADLDNNGCPDIYVSNDFHENDYLYFNRCDGTFVESLRSSLPYCSTFSMGSDIGDLNNDGWLDIMTLDMKPEDEVIRKSSSGADPFDIYNYKLSFGYHEQYPRNMLHINQGKIRDEPPRFAEIAQLAGVDATDWSWSVLLADLDNDRYQDIYITNGIYRRPNDLDYINYAFHEGRQNRTPALELVAKMPSGSAVNYGYRNRKNWQFDNVSDQWGLNLEGYSMGSAYADLDNDGDLDLVVNNLNAPVEIYRNNTETLQANNYLHIRLEGSNQNRFGIGTRVTLFLNNEQLTREVGTSRGWLSASADQLLFGLGDQKTVDSLMVRWPDGRVQTKLSVPANENILLRYDEAEVSAVYRYAALPLLESLSDTTGIRFQHRENRFVDFTRESLLPHGLSREGPTLAVGDLNGDGQEDLFIGGASGQAGALFFQDPDQLHFVKKTPAAFMRHKKNEDVDSAFFDADGDGDLDLYVVSGGGQWNTGPENSDRLYCNDGAGHFSISHELPNLQANGSCVVAADFNNDQRIDLFIGNRSVVGQYGYLPDAYLLWNRGNGRFELDTSAYARPLRALGMVTDATWDETAGKLWVVGEFMPVTVLSFQQNTILKETLKHSTGWWNTIYPLDVDQDGDLDFLAGNNGKNSPLHPSPTEPIRLIVKDWDHNGQSDPILTHHRQGKEWLYHGLDAIKKQIPVIRTRYNDYHLYAEHTLDQTFSEADLASATILSAETFESVLIINQGRGAYDMIPLPVEAQLAPIYAFYADDPDEDKVIDIFAMGNNAFCTPAIGNQRSSLGTYLQITQEGQLRTIPARQSGLQVTGEVRDIRSIKVKGETWIVVAKNDDDLEIWRSNVKSLNKMSNQ